MKYLEILVKTLLKTISFIISYKQIILFNRVKNRLYSYWLSNFLGKVGARTTICCPCQLEGGANDRIYIGDNTYIHSHSVLGCWDKYGEERFAPNITIGSDCSFGEYFHISATGSIKIGNGLLTGRFVYIGDNTHGSLSFEESKIRPINRTLISKGDITIGNNVWLGDRVTILGGVTIGNNVIVGANTVVTHDIPSNTCVVGAKNRVVKRLDNL